MNINSAITAVAQNPIPSIALTAMAGGVGCAFVKGYNKTAVGAGAATGVLGLGYAIKRQFDAVLEVPAKFLDEAGTQATETGIKLVNYAVDQAKKVMDSLGLGSIFNPLLDGAGGLLTKALSGLNAMKSEVIAFLKEYLFYVVMAFIAYRMLR